jgi:hypothetical protein
MEETMKLRLQRLKSPTLLALGAWLIGWGALAALTVEGVFPADHATFVFARVAAYLTVATIAALLIGFVAVFALACGAMLWWLDDAVGSTRLMDAVGRAFWVVAAYTWLGVALIIAEPPLPISMEDLSRPAQIEERMQDVAAYVWLERLRYAMIGIFLALVAWFLSRAAKPLNAVIAVAFGAAAIAGLGTLLGMIGSPEAG